jgi:GT2 family glycosyltransferase
LSNPLQPVADLIDASIILVNWNSLELTSLALNSIREHTAGIAYEVFVVDNGTTKDASVKELPRRFPWVTFIFNPENLGFTKANNQAIRRSRGRYVLLLNNDTVQIEDAIGATVRYLDAHPEVGALGIMHRNNDADRTFQESYFPFPDPRSAVLGLLGFEVHLPAQSRQVEQDVDWVCGSYLMMRRECLNQIGPLDERYFIYDEDIDWCFQAHRASWKVRYWPGASMIHLGATASPLMRDKTLVMFRSRLSYLRKNHSATSAFAFYLAMGFRLCLAVGKTALRWTFGRVDSAEFRQKWVRLLSFALLRPGRTGG